MVQSARDYMRTALDLMAVHAEKPVRGRQPRASLNPFTVVASIGSWERFIADLVSAAKEDDGHGPGAHKAADGSHRPGLIDRRLTDSGVLREALPPQGEVKFPANAWVGVRPRGRKTVLRSSPDEDREELLDSIAETRRTRNGAAHYALMRNAWDSAQEADQDGRYPRQSDADAPTLQSGCVRGVTAVLLRLIDGTAAIVARDHGWDPDVSRLPGDWFEAEAKADRFAGVRF